jgi:mono/diheme cytochrome c family protein
VKAGIAAIVSAAALTLAAVVAAQQPADVGSDLYFERCASCHGQHLNDGEFGPSLKSEAFRKRWSAGDGRALTAFVSATMPPGGAGSLPPEDYTAIVAYIRTANGLASPIK